MISSLRLGRAAAAPALRPAARRGVAARFQTGEATPSGAKAKIQFTLPLHVEFGQEVALLGDADTLGKWDASAAVPLTWAEGDVWSAELEVPIGSPVQYKYIIRASESAEVLEWQPCDNLVLELPPAPSAPLVVRDAWTGEAHELLVGGSPAAAPTVEAPAAEAPVAAAAVVATAEEAAPAKEAAAVPAAPVLGNSVPLGGKARVVAAAAVSEEDISASNGSKVTKAKATGRAPNKGPKGRRSA